MNQIQSIVQESKRDNWSYPKRFAILKAAGVVSHKVHFIDSFDSVYEGDFGMWQEPVHDGYTSPDLSDTFSEENIKSALLERAQGKTTYLEFLDALAASGVSHYKAEMKNNTVTYFNENENQFYQQQVPVWKEQ